jgi:ornithine racemase
LAGERPEFNEKNRGKTSFRALLDLGLLDINTKDLKPEDRNINISGASSDMLAVDLGTSNPGYRVGDLIGFNLNYMGTLHIMNSNYIGKKVI